MLHDIHLHEIFEHAHLKFTVSGRSKQASKQASKHTYTHAQCSHASVGLELCMYVCMYVSLQNLLIRTIYHSDIYTCSVRHTAASRILHNVYAK